MAAFHKQKPLRKLCLLCILLLFVITFCFILRCECKLKEFSTKKVHPEIILHSFMLSPILCYYSHHILTFFKLYFLLCHNFMMASGFFLHFNICICLEPEQKQLLILLLYSLNLDYSYHYFIHFTELSLFTSLLYLLHRIYNLVQWTSIWWLISNQHEAGGMGDGSGSHGSVYEGSIQSSGIWQGNDVVQTGTQTPTFCIHLQAVQIKNAAY